MIARYEATRLQRSADSTGLFMHLRPRYERRAVRADAVANEPHPGGPVGSDDQAIDDRV